jgi:hypothetical protein
MVWDTSSVVQQRSQGDGMPGKAIQWYVLVMWWLLDTRWVWVISFTLRPLITTGESFITHSTAVWMGSGAGLNALYRRKIIFTYEKSDYVSSSRPARSPVTIPVKIPWLLLQQIIYHYHQHIACRVSGLVTCSVPINSLEVIPGVGLRFVSHMVDIS